MKPFYLTLIAIIFIARPIHAQKTHALSIGQNYYAFASEGWGLDKIYPSTFISLDYTRYKKSKKRIKKIGLNADFYVQRGALFPTQQAALGKIVERNLLIINILFGQSTLRIKQEKHQLFLNQGFSIRLGDEDKLISLGREGGENTKLRLPGLTFSSDYIYHPIKHLMLKSTLGVSLYPQATYAFLYGGWFVGWCF
jgi:hypothetical protein